MKIELTLFRDILQAAKEDRLQSFMSDLGNSDTWKDGKDHDEILAETERRTRLYCQHLLILIEQGMIDGVTVKRSMDLRYSVGFYDPFITTAGTQFLSSLSSSQVMQRLKQLGSQMGVDLTVEFIKTYAPIALKEIFSQVYKG